MLTDRPTALRQVRRGDHGGGRHALLVVEATDRIDCRRPAGARLRSRQAALGGQLFELAPDCEIGAMPPIRLWGLPVYADNELREDRSIAARRQPSVHGSRRSGLVGAGRARDLRRHRRERRRPRVGAGMSRPQGTGPERIESGDARVWIDGEAILVRWEGAARIERIGSEVAGLGFVEAVAGRGTAGRRRADRRARRRTAQVGSPHSRGGPARGSQAAGRHTGGRSPDGARAGGQPVRGMAGIRRLSRYRADCPFGRSTIGTGAKAPYDLPTARRSALVPMRSGVDAGLDDRGSRGQA